MRAWLLSVICAALAAALLLWQWGGPYHVTQVSDEASYRLQAELFASGRLVGETPPLPRFFDMEHVLLEPAVVTKYPPLYPLSLAPGAALGAPWVSQLVLVALTAALLADAARRVAGPEVAALTLGLWGLSDLGLTFRPMLLSVHLSALLWAAAWWLLVARPRRLLVLLGGVLGLIGLTRPLTAVGLAPGVLLGVLQLPPALRPRRDALAGALLSGLCVGALLGWNAVVTGDPWRTPWALWSETYMPADHVGFGLDTTPPLVPMNAHQQVRYAADAALWASYTLAHLPAQAALRLGAILHRDLQGVPVGAVPLLWGGLALALHPAGRALRPLVVSAIGLFLVHLIFPHSIHWIPYYIEVSVVPPLLVASALWVLLARLGSGLRQPLALGAPSRWARGGLALFLALVGARAPLLLGADVAARGVLRANMLAFHAAVDALPGDRLVVFVAIGPQHTHRNHYVANGPDLPDERVWIVWDRGAENAALLALAPDRDAWRFDEATWTLTRLQGTKTTTE